MYLVSVGAGIFQSNKATLDYKIKKYNKYVVLLIAVTCFLRLQSTFFYSVCVNIYNTHKYTQEVLMQLLPRLRVIEYFVSVRAPASAPPRFSGHVAPSEPIVYLQQRSKARTRQRRRREDRRRQRDK